MFKEMTPELMKEVDQLREKYHLTVNCGEISMELFGVRIYLHNYAIKEVYLEEFPKYMEARGNLHNQMKLLGKYPEDKDIIQNLTLSMVKYFGNTINKEKTNFTELMVAITQKVIIGGETDRFNLEFLLDFVKTSDYAVYLGLELTELMLKAIKSGDPKLMQELSDKDILPYKFKIIEANSKEEAIAKVQEELGEEAAEFVKEKIEEESNDKVNLARIRPIGSA